VVLIKETTTEFAAPENSLVWDYFGHTGDENNGYCVSDGPFAFLTIDGNNNYYN